MSQQKFFDSESLYANGAGTPSEVWTHKYDAFGRQIEVKQEAVGQPSRISTMQYDIEGRLTGQSTAEGIISYLYDGLGRKTSTKVFPAGANPLVDTPERVTSYTYDSLSRLKTVSEDLDPASTADALLNTTYSYDLLSNLDRTDLPNGVVTDYTFDGLNRLDKMTHYGPDGTPGDLSNNPKRAEFDYTVRPDGVRTAATETFWLDSNNDGTPEPHVNQISWTYDDVGRVRDEVFNHFDNSLDQTEHFVYDTVGNRLSFTKDIGNNGTIDEAITYLYDANDRLITESLDSGNNGTTDQTTTYGWTGTQQVSKHVTAAGSSINRQTFAYDLQGKLSHVVNEGYTSGTLSSRERMTYEYDSTGIRVSSLNEADPGLNEQYQTSSRIEFLIDHNNFTGYQQVIKETTYDAQGVITKTIEYTIGHDEIAQTVTPYVNGNPDTANAETHIFGHDGHGSVRVLFDMAAAVVQVFSFDAFGQLMAVHNGMAQVVGLNAAAALTSLLYSGEQFDAKINQQYLRARFYDPSTGRFNRLDPFFGNLTDPLSLHKYAYTHNDPVNNIDPSGKFGFGASIGIGIGIGLLAFGIAWAMGYTPGQAALIGLAFGLGAFFIAGGLGATLLFAGSSAFMHILLGAIFLIIALQLLMHYWPSMPQATLASSLRGLTPGVADDPEADRIASAIAFTFNKNWRLDWRYLVPIIGAGASQRAKGYYCYEWVFAFEDAFNLENNGSFQAEVQAAKAAPEANGDFRVHYWLKISSTADPTKFVYVDDGFWDGTYVHTTHPCHPPGTAPGTRIYLFVPNIPIARGAPDNVIPPAYNAQGNIP